MIAMTTKSSINVKAEQPLRPPPELERRIGLGKDLRLNFFMAQEHQELVDQNKPSAIFCYRFRFCVHYRRQA